MNRTALAWALAYGGFGLAAALTGTPVLAAGGRPLPAAWDWAVVAVALAGVVAAGTGRRGLLWPAAGLALISAFGLLMNVLALVVGQPADGWWVTANQVLAAAGAVLLVRAAGPRGPVVRDVRWSSYAGVAAFVPYAAMKTIWALGGTFAGLSGAQVLADARRYGASGLWLTLLGWGLDPTALLAALGCVLLLALTHAWGRRLPRLLLLGPAFLGAATLAPYGVIGVGYLTLATAGVVALPRGDFPTSADALLVAWIGLGAFCVYGLALAVAAFSYGRSTVTSSRSA